MIVDVTGIILFPGNSGADCPGNGEHRDESGDIIECCCDECDYLMCCFGDNNAFMYVQCDDPDCPRSNQQSAPSR